MSSDCMWTALSSLPEEHFLVHQSRRWIEPITSARRQDVVPAVLMRMVDASPKGIRVPDYVPLSVLGRLFRAEMLRKALGAHAVKVVLPIRLEAEVSHDHEAVAHLAAWHWLLIERVNQATGGGLSLAFDVELAGEIRTFSDLAGRGSDKLTLGRDYVAAALLARERKSNPHAVLVRPLTARLAGSSEVTYAWGEDPATLRMSPLRALRTGVGYILTPNTYDLAGRPTHETVGREEESRIDAMRGAALVGKLPPGDAPVTDVQEYRNLLALRAFCHLGELAVPGIRQEALITREEDLASRCPGKGAETLTEAHQIHAAACRDLVLAELDDIIGALCPADREVQERAVDVYGLVTN